MNNQYNDEAKVNNEKENSEGEYVYKSVIKNKENRRTWSVTSLALAVLSVLSLFVPALSLVFGLLSVGAGALSRKNLGYFDRISLAGIIVGIFGCVFAVAGILFGSIIATLF